jgi:calcineurin-like phosphoesterase family protein
MINQNSQILNISLWENVWFTSDTHFGDERLNLYGRDLVFNNANEVDAEILKNLQQIGENDLLIHLGDVAFTEKGLENLNKINCSKLLVKGNYDEKETSKIEISDSILFSYFDEVVSDAIIEINGEEVYLNHYPTNAKSQMFNLVGHIHGTWKVQRNMINVGTDAWHFQPISLAMIKFQMNGIRKHYDQNVFAGEIAANTDHKPIN